MLFSENADCRPSLYSIWRCLGRSCASGTLITNKFLKPRSCRYRDKAHTDRIFSVTTSHRPEFDSRCVSMPGCDKKATIFEFSFRMDFKDTQLPGLMSWHRKRSIRGWKYRRETRPLWNHVCHARLAMMRVVWRPTLASKWIRLSHPGVWCWSPGVCTLRISAHSVRNRILSLCIAMRLVYSVIVHFWDQENRRQKVRRCSEEDSKAHRARITCSDDIGLYPMLKEC